jgi:sRNA-binding regulator protein Hfq
MSLSDYTKLLRALHGGVTPLEIQEATGISCAVIGEIETKYRRVGDDDAMLSTLATYFGVPLDELQRHREWYRKRLTAFLAEARSNGKPIRLFLTNGEQLVGVVVNADKMVIRLRLLSKDAEDVELMVQRHAVDHWEPVSSPEPSLEQVEAAILHGSNV